MTAIANGRPPTPLLRPGGALDPDTVRLHVAMLDDRRRTAAFLEAVRATVRLGDVVVEIGTGTGVLAVAAAQAGASRVYALEAANVAPWARQIFEANGVADRVRLVRGWAGEIKLPEPGDVLIAELIGDDPLGEGIVEITRDALRRLLAPGARLVPSGLAISCLPVTIPPAALRPRVFREDSLRRWRDWYGIDFSPLEDAWGGDGFVDFVDPRDARNWLALGPPAVVAAYDLEALGPARGQWGATVRINRAARLDGVLLFCDLYAGWRSFLSTAPSRIGADNHWYTPLRLLRRPVDVRPGDRLDVSYGRSRRTGRPWCTVEVHPLRGRRRASARSFAE